MKWLRVKNLPGADEKPMIDSSVWGKSDSLTALQGNTITPYRWQSSNSWQDEAMTSPLACKLVIKDLLPPHLLSNGVYMKNQSLHGQYILGSFPGVNTKKLSNFQLSRCWSHLNVRYKKMCWFVLVLQIVFWQAGIAAECLDIWREYWDEDERKVTVSGKRDIWMTSSVWLS